MGTGGQGLWAPEAGVPSLPRVLAAAPSLVHVQPSLHANARAEERGDVGLVPVTCLGVCARAFDAAKAADLRMAREAAMGPACPTSTQTAQRQLQAMPSAPPLF